MSEQRSPSGSDDAAAGSDGSPSWSQNGSFPEAAVAVVESPVADEAAAPVVDEAAAPVADEAAAIGDVTDEAPVTEGSAEAPAATDETSVTAGAAEIDPAPVENAEADAVATSSSEPLDDGSAFLAELVRAMQATAGAERARVAEATERRREAHIAGIHARRETEADRMRELAAVDLQAIDAQAEAERQRIDADRERRAAALQDDLGTSLAEHGSRMDREIAQVEAAITAYQADVDTFFAALDQETDPVAIAQQASRRPVFPTLETIVVSPTAASTEGAPTTTPDASSSAGPDGAPPADAPVADAPVADAAGAPAAPGLAVMDAPTPADLEDRWAAWNADSGQSGSVAAPAADQAASSGDAAEPVAMTAAAEGSDSAPVLQSVPILRPMSWLRRGHVGGDHQDNDT